MGRGVDAPQECRKYPVSEPDLSDTELELVRQAIQSTWISSTGKFLDQFEESFAEVCGVSDAVAVANGTVALHLILAALGIGPGDEVIVPSLTYIATANAVSYTGATPVFADVSPETWCLDPLHVESVITSRTAAIIAVHLYGHPADMDSLSDLAQRHGLALLEDAAEAPFARYHGRVTGGLALAASFSFYGNKILTCGEGGAVTTNDSSLARSLRLLRGQGMDPERRYFFPVVGFNYRLTNVAAALLCGQMSRREALLDRRRTVFDAYDRAMGANAGVELQPVSPWALRAPWLYTVLLRNGGVEERDSFLDSLSVVGVEGRPMFIPLHLLPPYQATTHASLEVTESLAARGFSLPTSSTMDAEDVYEISSRVGEALMRHADRN